MRCLLSIIFGFGFLLVLSAQPGTLDTTFNEEGYFTQSLGSITGQGNFIFPQENGELLVVGRNFGNFFLGRIQENGIPDPEFGIDGYFQFSVGFGLRVGGATIQPDGKVLITGRTSEGVVVVRLLPAGQIDTSFGDDGFFYTDLGYACLNGAAIKLQPDEKILISGEVCDNENEEIYFTFRLNPNGTLDPDFGEAGVFTGVMDPMGRSRVRGIDLKPDGRILLAGWKTTNQPTLALICLLPSGSLDETFGLGGVQFFEPSPGVESAAFDLKVLSSGKVLIAGYGGLKSGLLGLNEDLSEDLDFGTDGWAMQQMGDQWDNSYSLTIDESEKILVGGNRVNSSFNSAQSTILRYLPNGDLDTSFGVQGAFILDLASEDCPLSQCNDVAVLADGRVVATGTGINELGDEKFWVGRLNGSLPLEVKEHQAPKPIALKVFPNPVVSATTSIRFSLEKAGTYSASLYSSEGALVQPLWRNASFPPGIHERQIDNLSRLSPGSYYLRLVGAEGQQISAPIQVY